jgi:putative peptide zinc metalloprotease protein
MISESLICPDLTAHWQLSRDRHSQAVLLQAKQHDRQFCFTALEGAALQQFTGHFTIAQIQTRLARQTAVSPTFVQELLHLLLALDIVILEDDSVMLESSLEPRSPLDNDRPHPNQPRLKSSVQWIAHPNGYWLLRNPLDVTFLQVSPADKAVIEHLGRFPLRELCQRHVITPETLRSLLQLLSVTGMLEGTQPSPPPKRRFTPLMLLSFKVPVFNPDRWLTQVISPLHWLWSRWFAVLLSGFLGISAAIGLASQAAIFQTGEQLWIEQGVILLVPFGLLCVLVLAIHELGHALTLKHYGGIVPEVGLLVMCLMPGCYTNTTDAYCLVQRSQRMFVVAAGVIVQLTLWAIGLWLWLLCTDGTWLKTTSYLLMLAALLTVTLNLNPLTRLDGYYLAVALTGINNLRSRSFQFYTHVLTRQPIPETPHDRCILALYAPLSLLYTGLVFGQLLLWVMVWLLTHIPTIATILLILWVIYYLSAANPSTSHTSESSS